MKEITKEDLNNLVARRIIRNTDYGLVNKKGDSVGFYRTRHKRYIEDQYADMAFGMRRENR